MPILSDGPESNSFEVFETYLSAPLLACSHIGAIARASDQSLAAL